MSRYKIAPTKTNLFKMKHERDFMEEGYSLLKQKREILIGELMSLTGAVTRAQRECDEALVKAYSCLSKAAVVMGRVKIESAVGAVNFNADIVLGRRKVIGVDVPLVTVEFKDNPPYYGLHNTSAALDESVARFKDVLRLMGNYAQLKVTVLRIAAELAKTVRRVNALEKIYLPDCNDTIKYITESLEEQEREAFFTLKMVKARLEAKDR